MELKTFLKRLLKIVDIEKKKYIVNQIKCFSFLMIYTIASVIFPSFLSKIVDLGVVMGDVSNQLKVPFRHRFCLFSESIAF